MCAFVSPHKPPMNVLSLCWYAHQLLLLLLLVYLSTYSIGACGRVAIHAARRVINMDTDEQEPDIQVKFELVMK